MHPPASQAWGAPARTPSVACCPSYRSTAIGQPCDASRSPEAGRPGRTPTSSPRCTAPPRRGSRSRCRTTPRSARARDAAQGAGTGYVPGGVHEYRTTLAAPEEYRDQAGAARVRGRLPDRDGLRERRPGRLVGHRLHRVHRRPRRPPAVRRRQRDPRRLPRAPGLPLVLRRRHPPSGAPRRSARSPTSRSTASGSPPWTSTTSTPSSRSRPPSSTTAAAWPRSRSSPSSGTATARSSPPRRPR